MGQRSQIYIAFNKQSSDYPRIARGGKDKILIARYYQWNFGSRMVSRAAWLMRWLKTNIDTLDWKIENIVRISDTNFDFKDVVISQDIIRESEEYKTYGCKTPNEYVFDGQDNNDGTLFIKIEQDGTIKYAFSDSNHSKVMTAKQYMAWGKYSSEERDGSNYSDNCKQINEIAILMNNDELENFISDSYSNLKA